MANAELASCVAYESRRFYFCLTLSPAHPDFHCNGNRNLLGAAHRQEPASLATLMSTSTLTTNPKSTSKWWKPDGMWGFRGMGLEAFSHSCLSLGAIFRVGPEVVSRWGWSGVDTDSKQTLDEVCISLSPLGRMLRVNGNQRWMHWGKVMLFFFSDIWYCYIEIIIKMQLGK